MRVSLLLALACLVVVVAEVLLLSWARALCVVDLEPCQAAPEQGQ